MAQSKTQAVRDLVGCVDFWIGRIQRAKGAGRRQEAGRGAGHINAMHASHAGDMTLMNEEPGGRLEGEEGRHNILLGH